MAGIFIEVLRMGPCSEALVHSVILKAQKDLGLSSNTLFAPSTPSYPFLSTRQSTFSPNRLLGGINHPLPPLSIPNHYYYSASSTTWATLYELQNPDNVISPNNLALGSSSSMMTFSSKTSSLSSTMIPPKTKTFFTLHQTNISSSLIGAGGDPLLFPYWGGSVNH
jgi:hypothetical protein